MSAPPPLDAGQRQRVESLCLEALSKEGAERAAFLDRACEGNTRLRDEVDSLLAGEGKARGFLEGGKWPAAADDRTAASPIPAVAVLDRPAAGAPADLRDIVDAYRARRELLAPGLWVRTLVAVAATRVGLTLALYLSGRVEHGVAPVPSGIYGALSAAFGILGLVLVAANRRDVRAAWLGGIFVVAASPLASPLLPVEGAGGADWLRFVRPDAFLPALFLRFVAAFPTPLTGRPAAFARVAWKGAAVLGLFLAAISLSRVWWPGGADGLGWRAYFAPAPAPLTFYHPLVLGLTALAFPVLLARAHGARPEDRRRVLLFTGSLVAGTVPFAIQATLEVFPSYYWFIHRPGVELAVGLFLFGALASVPFVTAYSVLFDQVVELRVVLRAAAQYGLARYTILFVTMVPFVALALLVSREPLAAVLTGPRPLVLAGGIGAGLAAMRLRRRWIEALDRRFFREQYDARQTLGRLATGALRSSDAAELDAHIRAVIEPALHAETSLFVPDRASGTLRHARDGHDPVAANGVLSTLVAGLEAPMDVDPNDDRSPFRRLPADEQRWLLVGRFRLLLALRAKDGQTTGLLALSAKRSGLPYSDDDRRLLGAVAASAALALDNLRLRAVPQGEASPAARECLRCASLNAPDAKSCGCGGPVVTAPAPHVLRGVYRLDRRLGEGGMGVVYHARDLELGRAVAVKTLPAVTPHAAARLRAEARAMALVAHPNLAVVHSLETWQGIPFLVEEFLPGGTLADRLRRARMPVGEAVDLGITLADALQHLHAAGLVHRDIKPSNIGFTQSGLVKLLDFGLARIAAAVADSVGTTRAAAPPDGSAALPAWVGTPPYMSPEALLGDVPRPSFDLWSVAVVLYESIAGKRPFEGRDAVSLAASIANTRIAPVGAVVEGCPAAVDEYFQAALSPREERRPGDARSLLAALRGVRAALH